MILAFDPSGSFKEGKGNTGWVLIDGKTIVSFGILRASDYKTRPEYWSSHINIIESFQIDEVVMEEFRLYSSKAKSQINSEMETSKLLGFLEMYLWSKNIVYSTQLAQRAKQRFTDEILIKKEYITKKNGRYYINGINVAGHVIDALRHGLYRQLIIRRSKRNGINN